MVVTSDVYVHFFDLYLDLSFPFAQANIIEKLNLSIKTFKIIYLYSQNHYVYYKQSSIQIHRNLHIFSRTCSTKDHSSSRFSLAPQSLSNLAPNPPSNPSPAKIPSACSASSVGPRSRRLLIRARGGRRAGGPMLLA